MTATATKVPTARKPGLSLTSADEGKYLKAYLLYLANERKMPTAKQHFIPEYRAQAIRDFADYIAEELRG